MITINLRPGVKRAAAGGGASPLDRLKALGSRIKDPLPAAAVLVWIGVVGFLGWTYVRTSSQLAALEPQLEEARSENQRYKGFLTEKRREEVVRDSLLAQITTIQQVDGDRYVWPHILDEVSRALPAYTWLTQVAMVSVPQGALPEDSTAAPVTFDVSGRTVDIQGFTRFLRQLEDSPWIGNVTAVSAQTVVESNRAVTAFVVRASFTRADSAFIRSVPVSQSVVR